MIHRAGGEGRKKGRERRDGDKGRWSQGEIKKGREKGT